MTPLSIDQAESLVRAAARVAEEHDIRVAIVLLDASGHVLVTRRHHDAYFSAPTIAHAKAFTAVNFRVPTHAMAERLGSIDYAIQISQVDTRLTFIKGGLPIARDGQVIGAIGISGGSADQDLVCCQAALDAFDAGADCIPERG